MNSNHHVDFSITLIGLNGFSYSYDSPIKPCNQPSGGLIRELAKNLDVIREI